MAFRLFAVAHLGLGLTFLLGACGHNTSMPSTASAVSGTISYREGVTLARDAVIDIKIVDISPGSVAQVILAETTVRAEGRQVPLPFELRFDATRVAASHTYGIKAEIRSGGQVLFATDAVRPVITQGNPSRVDLMLVQRAQ